MATDDHRQASVAREVDAELRLSLDGEDLANDAVLVGSGPEPLSPLVDEEVAEDDASITNGEGRPEIGDVAGGRKAPPAAPQGRALRARRAPPPPGVGETAAGGRAARTR